MTISEKLTPEHIPRIGTNERMTKPVIKADMAGAIKRHLDGALA